MERREHTYGYEEAAGVTPPPWTGPAVGLMDLDAFFASVEMLDHPEWRGKPLIVGGDAESRGVVSTCSYEARRFGVHSAMASAEARRLCPQAIWTHGHFDRYREVSAQVMAILADETPRVERVSIDEAFIDITPGRFAPEDPLLVARRISDRVAALGVTCSIGVGCNKAVAKIASERDKPFGLDHCAPRYEQRFLAAAGICHERNRAFGREATASHAHLYTRRAFTRARVHPGCNFWREWRAHASACFGARSIRGHQPG
ncbi:MAG: Y-family DNA polymerase [Collinsella sp.]